MTIETIDELAGLLQKTVVTRISVEGDGWNVELERPPAPPGVATAASTPAPSALEARAETPVEATMVGVFHEASHPVAQGQIVRAGEALGSIEALALRNEVRAPMDGRVEEVHVEDGQPVEFGQVLFVLSDGVDE
ncbi:MAG TPA: biotin/lipoyl-binding protein [Armatimonadota bacterium]